MTQRDEKSDSTKTPSTVGQEIAATAKELAGMLPDALVRLGILAQEQEQAPASQRAKIQATMIAELSEMVQGVSIPEHRGYLQIAVAGLGVAAQQGEKNRLDQEAALRHQYFIAQSLRVLAMMQFKEKLPIQPEKPGNYVVHTLLSMEIEAGVMNLAVPPWQKEQVAREAALSAAAAKTPAEPGAPPDPSVPATASPGAVPSTPGTPAE